MSISRNARLLPLLALPCILAITGCEEPATPTNDGQPKSTLGKAKAKADQTVDKMQKRQEELSRQADSIFDDN